MSFEIGQKVGPYRVTKYLGKGGMATVYKAHHDMLDRDVAIKVLHVAFKDDETFIERFRREAQIVGKLDHANIVSIYDFSDVGQQPYLVMKYIEGNTLKQYLRAKEVLSLTETVEVLSSVASALDYAHKHGILHRDVKPSNIMMDKEAQPHLTDFGLARIASLGESTLSRDMMLGTPQYISPEQAQGNRELDARTDVYSLGIVLYELVVGRVPFQGDTPYAIIHNHIFTPLPPPSDVNPTVPMDVQEVLMQALAKDPNDRFSSAGAMMKAFKDAVSGKESAQISAAAYRPEAFQKHAEQSMQQPAIQSPMGAGTPPPMAQGTWISNVETKNKRQGFLSINLWAITGCLLLCISFAVASSIWSNAQQIALSQSAPPIISDSLAENEDEATDDEQNTDIQDEIIEYSIQDVLDQAESIEDIENFLNEHPDEVAAYFALGIAYLEDDQPVVASTTIVSAVNEFGTNPGIVREAAEILSDRGFDELAIRVYSTAIDLDPEDEIQRNSAGEYFYQLATEESRENLVLLCRLVEDNNTDRLLNAMLGRSLMANSPDVDLEDVRWPVTCRRSIRQPVDELLSIGEDFNNLAPEIVLIQVDYYERIGEDEFANTILNGLLEASEGDEIYIPEWIIEETQSRLEA